MHKQQYYHFCSNNGVLVVFFGLDQTRTLLRVLMQKSIEVDRNCSRETA